MRSIWREGVEFPTIFIPTDLALTLDFLRVRDSPKIMSRCTTVLHRDDYTRKIIMTEKDFSMNGQIWKTNYPKVDRRNVSKASGVD